MIDFNTPQALDEAVKALSARTPLGSRMRSAEWEQVSYEIRDRAFFSAQVEDERLLAVMKGKILQKIKAERSKDRFDLVMDRARFIAEMQDELKRTGYQPKKGKTNTLEDLSSAGRLGLIWDMQVSMAYGYAFWTAALDPDILQAFPALELVRGEARREPRDWPKTWAENGGQFYGEPGPAYPSAPGRMIALVTSDIWRKISRFGTPWTPLDWGSGMILRRVKWRDALKLGVLKEDEEVAPPEKLEAFNEEAKASTKGLPPESKERLRSNLGDAVRMEADEIRLVHESTKETIPQSLERRSRALAAELQTQQLEADEVAAVTAVSVGRRSLAVLPNFPATVLLPAAVQVLEVEGRTFVWRPDVTNLPAATLAQLPDSGLAILQGLADPADATAVEVTVRGPKQQQFRFKVPRASALVWTRARLADFTLALGPGWKANLDGKEVTL